MRSNGLEIITGRQTSATLQLQQSSLDGDPQRIGSDYCVGNEAIGNTGQARGGDRRAGVQMDKYFLGGRGLPGENFALLVGTPQLYRRCRNPC
ncbi:MAG: hypothetical protein R6X18_00865 [Chloroflexota bacterium]|jgi:hypothetical protein